MASTSDRLIGTPGAQRAGWPVDLLQAIWSEQQPLLDERIGVIERAASALDQNRLGERLRAEAQRAAHMLAGSIGIFGFDDASQAAHALELELACPSRERAQTMHALTSRLRNVHAGRR
jgi:chemotaxis protein histidine kinase CheA